MQKYTYIYILDTYRRNDKDARRKTQRDFFIKYFTSHFICKVLKRVTQSLHVRGSWRPNITKKFGPQSYGRQRCVFLFSMAAQPKHSSPICWVLAFLTTSCLSPSPTILLVLNSTRLSAFCSIRWPYITFKLPHGDMDTPPCLCNFFRYLATRMCHFRYLWNGLCDRHRAEITVMQFRGHSLPVRQSIRV